jgi:hypothetical protein
MVWPSSASDRLSSQDSEGGVEESTNQQGDARFPVNAQRHLDPVKPRTELEKNQKYIENAEQ